MLELLRRFQGYFVAALTALAAVAAIYLRGRSAGKEAERQDAQAKVNKQAAQAAKEVSDVQIKIDRMPDGAAADELRSKWMRR